jgi:hypothetical protein
MLHCGSNLCFTPHGNWMAKTQIRLIGARRVELTIQGMGRKVTGRIETFDKSKTWMTTFQLR